MPQKAISSRGSGILADGDGIGTKDHGRASEEKLTRYQRIGGELHIAREVTKLFDLCQQDGGFGGDLFASVVERRLRAKLNDRNL
jgi:hypothetical protein